MIALARFQVAGYVRSLRALPPFVVVVLLLLLVVLQGSAGNATLAVGALGDVAAFLFPVWAWTARSVLDTQPDEQRALSALAVRARAVSPESTARTATPARARAPLTRLITPHSRTLAGLLAAYAVNLGLAALALAVPLLQALLVGAGPGSTLAGSGLCLLVALAATVLGAWTSRAIIPHPGFSLLALLGGTVAALLLSLSPLSTIAVPMVDWLRAAHDGPAAFTDAFPALTLHLALWTLVVGTAYLLTSRTRL